MSTLSAATAAPSPVKIGNREYLASPLTLADLGALEERVKAAYIANAASAAKVSGDSSILDRAMTAAMGITYDSPEASAFIRTRTGLMAIVCLSLRNRQPGIDERALATELREHPDDFLAALDTVNRISGLVEEEKRPGEASGGEKPG